MRILKKLFTKTFLIIFVLICFLGVFFYWGWFEKQYDKVLGMYYVYKGDKAYQKAKLQDAINYYNRGLKLYPGHYGARFNLGNIYVVYEDYYAAADAYQKAIDYNKKFTLARMNLGVISTEKLGDFDGAIEQYKAIINSKSFLWFIPFVFNNIKSERINRGLAYYNMGVAYRQKALYQEGFQDRSNMYLLEAIKAYKNAARILKKDYDTRYNMALAYHLVGDYQNAGLNYCKAIDLKPMNYEAHYNLAVLLRHLRMYKEAYHELEKATVLVNNDSGGNSNTSTYIFDVLNEVSRILVVNDQYKYITEKIDDETSSNEVTYVKGKIVPTDALDRAMLKNFKTCETKDFFENY
ncbi:MAG: tetratricopeptide repeat protein [Candidatus Gastranaerophilales bacterium]|nr:tetratricopeptide repeat protein [Candidatus Gastranaerophilales bacterium]